MIKPVTKLAWRRYLRRNAREWDELELFRSLPPNQQRRVLAERLLAQIQYFGNRGDALPEWREAGKIRDPEELWRVWPELPIINKGALQSQFSPAVMQPRFGLLGTAGSTGGSTGEPTPFFHDLPMMRATAAAAIYARLRMGWCPGLPTVVIWGSERDIGKRVALRTRTYNRLLNTFVVGGYNLTDRTAALVVDLVRRHQPVAVYGFTSMLAFVARKALELNIAPPAGAVKTAWNGGEMLFEQQRGVFREAFGVPLLNCYGGRELSTMAFQDREGSPLQIVRPWLFAEVVDARGKPVAPGEPGRLLWTSTVCRGTPFLRYDIGDLATYDRAHQDESGISALHELHGRLSGLIRLTNGKYISCLYWNHLLKEVPDLRQFQVVHRRDESLHLLLNGGNRARSSENALRTTLRQFLGDVPVQIDWVEAIPLTARGKLVQVVHERVSGGADPTQRLINSVPGMGCCDVH